MKSTLPDTEKIKAQLEPDCTKCIHFKVCAIVRGFAPMIENSFNEKNQSPVKPFDLAKICIEYKPVWDTGVIPQ